jgi:hypothetical protein
MNQRFPDREAPNKNEDGVLDRHLTGQWRMECGLVFRVIMLAVEIK